MKGQIISNNMKQEVIAVFDIGKTNKKILLFDDGMNLVFQEEEKFDGNKG